MEPTQPNKNDLQGPQEPGQASEPAVQPVTPPTTDEPNRLVAPDAQSQAAEPIAAAHDSQSPLVVGGAEPVQAATAPPQPESGGSGEKGRKWLLPVGVAATVVLLAGGYVFGYYLPNRPSAVYSAGLKNSGKAVDALVSYSDNLSQKHYKSYGFDGSVSVKSADGSVDGTLTGAFDLNANANVTLKLDALGQKVDAEMRSLKQGSNTSPDLYVRLTGIKPLLNSLGASGLDGLDGQWVAIDHTILDTYVSNADASASSALMSDSMPTFAQIHDAAVKTQEVNKQYLFTSDPSKAVLTQDNFVGKETKDGRSVYHYKVNYDKAHLKAYGNALKQALDSSSLNDWSKRVNNGKNLSDAFNDSPVGSGGSSSIAMPLDMWIDTKTKLVHAIQFRDTKDTSSVATISQNYTGGDDYPFALDYADKTTKGSLKFVINKVTDKATLDMAGQENSADYGFDFKVTPSNNVVSVTAPSNAQPIMNVISQLGVGSSL